MRPRFCARARKTAREAGVLPILTPGFPAPLLLAHGPRTIFHGGFLTKASRPQIRCNIVSGFL